MRRRLLSVLLVLALMRSLMPMALASETQTADKITGGTFDHDPTENLAAGYAATEFINKSGETNWLVTPDYTSISASDVNETGWYDDAFIMMPVGASVALRFASEYSLSGTYTGAISTTHDAGISSETEKTPKSVTYTFTSTSFHNGWFKFVVQADAADGTRVTVCERNITVVITPRSVTFMDGETQYAKLDADGRGLISADGNTTIGLPDVPTKEGCTFGGWFTAQDVEFTATTPVVNSNLTVYARWTENAPVTPDPEPEDPAEPEDPVAPDVPEADPVPDVPVNSGTTTTVLPGGAVEAEIPAAVAADAARSGEPVTLPMKPVASTTQAALAPTVTVKTNSPVRTPVEIPVTAPTAGTVIVVVQADGTETVVPTCTVSGSGVIADLPDGAVVKVVDRAMQFGDVADDDWFSNAVDFVSARGILTGTDANQFGASAATSRAMVWTLLARLSDVDTEDGETWYSTARDWAVENGISDGTDANGEITREQLVTMLWRFMDEPAANASLSDFTDSTAVSSWSQAASRWAVGNDVMNGVNGALDPQGITTRGQLAQFIMNFINNAM